MQFNYLFINFQLNDEQSLKKEQKIKQNLIYVNVKNYDWLLGSIIMHFSFGVYNRMEINLVSTGNSHENPFQGLG